MNLDQRGRTVKKKTQMSNRGISDVVELGRWYI